MSHQTPDSFRILRFLLEVLKTVHIDPRCLADSSQLEDYKSFLRILDWRISSVPVSAFKSPTSDSTTAMELFQLATLVYLERASGNISGDPNQLRQRIDRAFSIFSRISACERRFPLFVLGCEARTDEERIIVLDLISRTEKETSSRVRSVKRMIEVIWSQDDLAQRELDYMQKLGAIISSYSILPIFV